MHRNGKCVSGKGTHYTCLVLEFLAYLLMASLLHKELDYRGLSLNQMHCSYVTYKKVE